MLNTLIFYFRGQLFCSAAQYRHSNVRALNAFKRNIIFDFVINLKEKKHKYRPFCMPCDCERGSERNLEINEKRKHIRVIWCMLCAISILMWTVQEGMHVPFLFRYCAPLFLSHSLCFLSFLFPLLLLKSSPLWITLNQIRCTFIGWYCCYCCRRRAHFHIHFIFDPV